MIQIFSGEDSLGYRWQFCYLHGNAEDVLKDSEDCAPDIFTASESMPDEPGTYPCTINGLAAVAVIAMHYGRLGGRVAMVRDTKSLKHALTPEDWR